VRSFIFRMFASRTLARSARVVRVPVVRGGVRSARFQSSSSVTQTSAQAGGASGLVGGLAGGALVFAVSFSRLCVSMAATHLKLLLCE
jgi:predicted lipid-binding transport protein (Tim44 family)